MNYQNNIKFSSLRSVLLILLGAMLSLTTIAQTKIAGWERTYSFGGEQLPEARSVVQTYDEGFVMVSQHNTSRFRITKTDPDGNILWDNLYGELAPVEAESIIQLTDGSYAVVGSCRNCGPLSSAKDVIVYRLDRYGNEMTGWPKIFGLSLDDSGNSVKATPDNGFIIAGIQNTEEFAEQAYFIKLNAAGDIVFENAFGSENREIIKDVESVPDGYIATGYQEINGDRDLYLIKLNTAGDSLWSVAYGNAGIRNEGNAITLSYDDENNISGYVAAGLTGTLGNGTDVFLVHVNINGDAPGTVVIPGGPLTDQAFDIESTSDRGYIITGTTEPNALQSRALLTKLNTNYDVEWTETFGIPQNNVLAASQGFSVKQTKDEGYVIGGFRSAPDNFDELSVYLIKTNSEGQIFTNYLQGRVFNEQNAEGIEDWVIVAKEQSGGEDRIFYATSGPTGEYRMLLTTGSYDFYLETPNDYWTPSAAYALNINIPNNTSTLDFPVGVETDCTDLEVDISTPYLIRGVANTYTVNYCNHGNDEAEDAYVDVVFDTNILVTGSSIPFTQVGNIQRFQIGDVDFGDCGEFKVQTILQNGGVEEQQTHCATANIYPNTLCNEIDPAWDGSSIKVTGVCETIGAADSIRFNVINQGNDDMLSPASFIIIEDVVLRTDQPQTFQLESGASTEIAYEATGGTFRIMSQQATGHPGDSRPTVAIEGCGGFTPGHVTRFPEDDYNFSVEMDCQENVAQPLTNVKRGYPKGTGDSLLIAANTDMIYHLKFQNIGTETAIRVVIRDTISPHLDPTTIRPGASSHDYDFEVYAGGILKFTFENINLPGSSTDEAGSHIFVKYRISQQPSNEVGTPLNNGTAITFEFDAPQTVITDEQFIGGLDWPEMLLTTHTIYHPEVNDLKIYPNPFSETANFELTTSDHLGNLHFTLFDLTGRQLRNEQFSGNNFQLHKEGLTSGMYIFRIEANGALISTGKVIVQ